MVNGPENLVRALGRAFRYASKGEHGCFLDVPRAKVLSFHLRLRWRTAAFWSLMHELNPVPRMVVGPTVLPDVEGGRRRDRTFADLWRYRALHLRFAPRCPLVCDSLLPRPGLPPPRRN